jgi:hypothetical protein
LREVSQKTINGFCIIYRTTPIPEEVKKEIESIQEGFILNCIEKGER